MRGAVGEEGWGSCYLHFIPVWWEPSGGFEAGEKIVLFLKQSLWLQSGLSPRALWVDGCVAGPAGSEEVGRGLLKPGNVFCYEAGRGLMSLCPFHR